MSAPEIGSWWQTFFDDDYLRVWGASTMDADSDRQADGLWQLLQLKEGSRVLDAPCGYGRLSRRLAERGAITVGVDQSQVLLDHAEQTRGDISPGRLRYIRHDLRLPLAETAFDAAINIFSSLGYGTEAEDLAILQTLCAAVRPGGFVFVETNHRDVVIAFIARGGKSAMRLPHGTLVVEEPNFDPVAGRVNTTWYWSGPQGSGQKSASLRVYCTTELIALIERAGLRFRSAHDGCSPGPFKMEGRLGLLAERVEP